MSGNYGFSVVCRGHMASSGEIVLGIIDGKFGLRTICSKTKNPKE